MACYDVQIFASDQPYRLASAAIPGWASLQTFSGPDSAGR